MSQFLGMLHFWGNPQIIIGGDLSLLFPPPFVWGWGIGAPGAKGLDRHTTVSL